MATSKVTCALCKISFSKENREINRAAGRGVLRHFCSRSCSAKYAALSTKKPEIQLICPCGKVFITTLKSKASRHCSFACASHFSMTESRREAQRLGGLQQASNLLPQDVVLRMRESWKYSALRDPLGSRPYQFEFPLGGYMFDLALLDTGTLIEFDVPYHSGEAQVIVDAAKDSVARENGFSA